MRTIGTLWRERHPAIGAALALTAPLVAIAALVFAEAYPLPARAALAAGSAAIVILAIVRRINRRDVPQVPPDDSAA